MSMTVEISEPIDLLQRMVGLTIKYNTFGEHIPLLKVLGVDVNENYGTRHYESKTHTFTIALTSSIPKEDLVALLLLAKEIGIYFEVGHNFPFYLEEELWVS